MPLNLLEATNAAEGSKAEILTAELMGEDPIFNRIHWINEPTTQYMYSQVVSLGDAGTRALNDQREGSFSRQAQYTENRRIFSDQMLIDRQIIAGDPARRAKEEFRKIESIREAWLRMFFKGSSAIDPTQFDGLQVRSTRSSLAGRPSRKLMNNSVSGAPLSLGMLRRAIDNTSANAILMPEQILQYLSEAGEIGTLKGAVLYNKDEFGMTLAYYGGLPIIPIRRDSADNYLLDNTELSADGSRNDCTSIYIVGFGEGKLQGINFQGVDGRYGIDVKDQGEQGPFMRTFIDWPCSIVDEHQRCFTRLRGIVPGGITA